ncbi:Juvenile hormone acid O-methyltransferase like protein [Argiope bruennichi]|uniref:Juvenile hormone acid O-methyltransferase like protein n=1 Tax=Argiope bruennichi TaxID=94029 RepID=A0A8T0ES25_ARGBR|nr:Juvenile hormone acid O-methyltransferase like protein [Argiope bruennichi]
MAWCEATNDETKDFLCSLRWGDLSGELVMDIGCGMGYMSTKCILQRFPRVSEIVAIDKDPYCIHRSQMEFKNDSYKKVKFHCISITDMAELEPWKGKISKIFSFHCISFVRRQERAFRNMFELLIPGGQAALLFVLRSESDDVYLEMMKNPKWSRFFRHMNDRKILKLRESDPTYYSNMLKQIGFLVLFCREKIIEHVFYDDEECKDVIWESTLLENIPRELQDEFVEEAFSTFLTLHPRNEADAALKISD